MTAQKKSHNPVTNPAGPNPGNAGHSTLLGGGQPKAIRETDTNAAR